MGDGIVYFRGSLAAPADGIEVLVVLPLTCSDFKGWKAGLGGLTKDKPDGFLLSQILLLGMVL